MMALLVVGCGSSTAVTPDGATGGGVDTAVPADAARPADTAAPADTAVPADTAAPADTAIKNDTAATPDTGMAMTGKSLDECFAGLRPLVGSAQDATRASADGKYKVRLALETDGRTGTSGSHAWAAIRFAIETPEGTACVTDEAALAMAYKGSHHNCMDVLTVDAGGRRYVIQNPDSAVEYGDPTKWRRQGSLSIFMGATMVAGPIVMQTSKCNQGERGDGLCRSGGPCQ
jgi:hypothetical protein